MLIYTCTGVKSRYSTKWESRIAVITHFNELEDIHIFLSFSLVVPTVDTDIIYVVPAQKVPSTPATAVIYSDSDIEIIYISNHH